MNSIRLLLPMITLSCISMYAQNIHDALRYSNDGLTGTARYSAMGGAFGAVGGDFSAMQDNPAGSAIFSSHQSSISLFNRNTVNKSLFNGTTTEECKNNFDLNQGGIVFVFDNTNENELVKKITFGFNFDLGTTFDENRLAIGNNNRSVADYFLHYAQGIPLNTIGTTNYEWLNYREQQAFMGYEGYIINPVNGTNDQYESNVANAPHYAQQNLLRSEGYNGKFTFNLATQVGNNWHFGLNLNANVVDYKQYHRFNERNPNTQDDGVRTIYFENDLYTYGTGFSFQLGTIGKLTDNLRVGASYQSPTWYRLNDETTQYLVSTEVNNGTTFTNVVNPSVINIYPKYKLQNPSKFQGSLAYVFGRSGLISFDYLRKDYSNTKFRPSSDAYFASVNDEISDMLTVVNEFRIGGEYRIKKWSIRGGYRFESSPYKEEAFQTEFTTISTGLGYNFGPSRIDISYANNKGKFGQKFYDQGLNSSATYDQMKHTIIATYTFLF